jgi:DNA-binding transcriptional LysR family regulator
MNDDMDRVVLDNAEEAAAAVISGLPYGVVPSELVEYIPQGEYVPPCPFPCHICVRKGRQ